MDQEYAALLQNNTWDLCPCPLDEHIIDTKWVYKMKQKEDGSLDRCKARLVAKGFEQVYDIDYSETIFIPVIKPAMVCLVLAIVTLVGLYANWIFLMPFFLAPLMKKSLLNNLVAMLILIFLIMCVNSTRLFMCSNKILELGSNAYLNLLWSLTLLDLRRPDDHRYTTDYGVFLRNCLASWCAKKQSVVSRSSTKAEYRALAMTIAEVY